MLSSMNSIEVVSCCVGSSMTFFFVGQQEGKNDLVMEYDASHSKLLADGGFEMTLIYCGPCSCFYVFVLFQVNSYGSLFQWLWLLLLSSLDLPSIAVVGEVKLFVLFA